MSLHALACFRRRRRDGTTMHHKTTPQVSPLEDRVLLSGTGGRGPLAVSAVARPNVLWPPNHKLVPVVVTGHVSDNLSRIEHVVTYQVVDEYREVQPGGSAVVNARGNYRFVVDLQSSRLGQDKNGRQYVVLVTARDVAGNYARASSGVLVPHDMGHGIRGRFSGPVPVQPQRPNSAELRQEHQAAREHALEARRAEVAANRKYRAAIVANQEYRAAIAANREYRAAVIANREYRIALQYAQQQPQQVGCPAAAHGNQGNGNDNGNHDNGHGHGNGNQGNGHGHGNQGNGHGHGKK